MNSPHDLLTRAQASAQQWVDYRRDLHAHPELGFQEHRTAAQIAAALSPLGCRLRTGVGRTGVVAELGSGSPVIAIRADMDALPIQEENEVPYASQAPGQMHACGHDAHVAIALGAAHLLAGESFPGTVRFLFQPAEEVGDEEGISGAPRMIQDQAMQGVTAALALHVDASLAVGEVAIGSGPMSAGVDTFYATLLGRGGHGALLHPVIDPIHIAGHVLLALHGIVSRRTDPYDPAVVSVGSIHAGQASNVIPDTVELSGTLRYMDPEVQALLHQEIESALGIARALGGDYRLKLEIGYPPMINHPQVSGRLRQVALDLLGEAHVYTPRPHMGAEDFGFFSQIAPGAMLYLGAGDGQNERPLHTARFDLDEACLPIGVALLAETALRCLRSPLEPA